MTVAEKLLSIDKSLNTPVYLQIANDVICYIRKGTLKPGTPLPASRALATTLNVHRKTVVAAYDELYAQSWIDVYPRKGIFVAKNLPDIAPKPLAETLVKNSFPTKTYFEVNENYVPFTKLFQGTPDHHLVINEGYPDTRIVPIELLVREFRRFGSYKFTSKHLLYGPEQGSANLRQELARFLFETRGVQVSPDNIVITKGVQMALYLTARILISKGDTAIAADPGYTGANEVFLQVGANLALVPVDDQGMDLDAVEEICQKQKVKLLYVTPHHHQPTTVTLSSERRMRLLELAMKYKFAIIEDDYDYDFHYSSSPILPLASADYYGSVVYVGSFGKTIAPGIRIGFIVAPQNLITQVARLRRMIDRQGEQLLEEAMANLLKNGDISRHLKKANKIYHERRDAFCRMLNEQLPGLIKFKVPDGGFGIWAEYQHGIQTNDVAIKAAEMGLSVGSGCDHFHNQGPINSFARLGFASLNLTEMEEALDILGKAVKKLV